MTLLIDLPAELERRLEEEAERRGQAPSDYAREVLEEKLAVTGRGSPETIGTSEAITDDYLTRFPRRSPEDLVALARQQGVPPFAWPEEASGQGKEEVADFDVDAFLAARKQWQQEGRLPGSGLAEPDDATE